MIRSDYHMHSSFSGDSKEDMIAMIKKSKEIGLENMCFTEHYDPLFPCYQEGEDAIFDLDVKKYIDYTTKLREKTELMSGINVCFGMELGIFPDVYELGKEIAESAPYDFIICSSHTAGKIDPYLKNYWEHFSNPVEGILFYYKEILENVKNFDNYDVYGHIDYCVRYTETTKEDRDISHYRDILKDIFTVIVEKGKGIEINSGGLRKKLNEFNPNGDILKLYKECGGEIITFGSDAHNKEDIAYGIKEASELLESIGFKYIAVYKERKPSFIKL